MSSLNLKAYISVDIEASGPIPGEFSMLTLGACSVTDGQAAFECMFKPISMRSDPKALEVTGLSLEQAESQGSDPESAMREFEQWVIRTCGDTSPVFVGLNAGFDWSFVNYYFHRFLGRNPFGFAPLDMKAFYMGLEAVSWEDARSSRMTDLLKPELTADHNALTDARAQAELFRLMLARQQLGISKP